jgi:hypothetical protein
MITVVVKSTESNSDIFLGSSGGSLVATPDCTVYMTKTGHGLFVLVAGDGGEAQEVGPYHHVAHLQWANCTVCHEYGTLPGSSRAQVC